MPAGYPGILVTRSGVRKLVAELPVRPELMVAMGFLHVGSVATLADMCSGYGCLANLLDGASGFTTVELKSNHLEPARDGTLVCVARAAQPQSAMR
jgi:uncharacterized protein (TIGR00369 family)